MSLEEDDIDDLLKYYKDFLSFYQSNNTYEKVKIDNSSNTYFFCPIIIKDNEWCINWSEIHKENSFLVSSVSTFTNEEKYYYKIKNSNFYIELKDISPELLYSSVFFDEKKALEIINNIRPISLYDIKNYYVYLPSFALYMEYTINSDCFLRPIKYINKKMKEEISNFIKLDYFNKLNRNFYEPSYTYYKIAGKLLFKIYLYLHQYSNKFDIVSQEPSSHISKILNLFLK